MHTNTDKLYIPDETDCRTCNMCMSQCPTFKTLRQPDESPRGRLKLITRLLHDEADALTPDDIGHLNSCVECGACEKVCPSKMSFLALLEAARMRLATRPVLPMVRVLRYLARHRALLRYLFSGLRIYQRSGMQHLLEASGLLKLTGTQALNHMLPKLGKYRHVAAFYPATETRRGAVGLFTGCLSNTIDSNTLHATIKVLNRFGYDVHVPQQQYCCGAIHAHNNDNAGADQLAELNLHAFNTLPVDNIIFTASACGAMLSQYNNRSLNAASERDIEKFTAKLVDINAFIASQEWPSTLELKPLYKRIAVHEPCSQQYPLATHKQAYAFLERIPGIKLSPLPDNHICCGAGGTYMLSHAQMSDAIRAEKLKHLQNSDADILVTSNIGCALHLASGISQSGMQVIVAHPVELLAQQII